MSIDLDQKGLSLDQRLKYMQRDLKLTDMIPVYWNKKEFGIYCALIPSIQVERALSKSSWDLHFYQGTPSAVGVDPFQYLRYGDDNGIEPLVVNRDFNESQTNYGRESTTARYPRSSVFSTISITTAKKMNISKLMMKVMNT